MRPEQTLWVAGRAPRESDRRPGVPSRSVRRSAVRGRSTAAPRRRSRVPGSAGGARSCPERQFLIEQRLALEGGEQLPSGSTSGAGRQRRCAAGRAASVSAGRWSRVRAGSRRRGHRSRAGIRRCCRRRRGSGGAVTGLLNRGGVPVERALVVAEHCVLDRPAEVGGVVADQDDLLDRGRALDAGDGWAAGTGR